MPSTAFTVSLVRRPRPRSDAPTPDTAVDPEVFDERIDLDGHEDSR